MLILDTSINGPPGSVSMEAVPSLTWRPDAVVTGLGMKWSGAQVKEEGMEICITYITWQSWPFSGCEWLVPLSVIDSLECWDEGSQTVDVLIATLAAPPYSSDG